MAKGKEIQPKQTRKEIASELAAPGGELDPPHWLQRALGYKPPAPVSADEITAAWEAPHPDPNEEGVAELLRIAEATVDDERERGRQLDGKASNLVAVSGLILTIETALAKTVFTTDLGSAGVWFARGGFALAVTAVFVAALLASGGVMMPQKYRGLDRNTLRDFQMPETQALSELEVRQSMLASSDVMLRQDRPLNDFKARLVKRVVFSLLIGFGGLAAQALTIAVKVVTA
jgi:hypothetical protein